MRSTFNILFYVNKSKEKQGIVAQFNSSVDDHPVTTAEYSTQTIHIS